MVDRWVSGLLTVDQNKNHIFPHKAPKQFLFPGLKARLSSGLFINACQSLVNTTWLEELREGSDGNGIHKVCWDRSREIRVSTLKILLQSNLESILDQFSTILMAHHGQLLSS
jgi:hypothetical protein